MPKYDGPDIIEFAMSSHYLGKSYLSAAQRAALKALYGLALDTRVWEKDHHWRCRSGEVPCREALTECFSERTAWLEIAEGREPRRGGYQEASIICGVRGGKTSEFASIVGTYECVRWGPSLHEMLIPGQVATGILIAQNEKGANTLRGYIEGNINTLEEPACGDGCHWNGGILAPSVGQEKAITGKAIRLVWPIEIVIYPANRQAVRSVTGLFALMDEIAYWETSEGAFAQDKKVLTAVNTRFATLAKLKPKKVKVSSPDEESGVLYESYQRRDTGKELVVKCPTWLLNPKIDEDDPEFFETQKEKDPESFDKEYAANFAKPGGGNIFLLAASVDQCIDRGVMQREPQPGKEYSAWMDAAFKRDRFSVAIAHRERQAEGDTVVFDMARHWTPSRRKGAKPLDDEEIVEEIVSTMLRPYGVDRIYGDQFADVPLQNKFAAKGISFVMVAATKPEKFEAYKNLRAALKTGQVRLLDDELMIRDLKGLVRKESKDGYTVSAPKRHGSYDDAATVVSRLVRKLLPLGVQIDLAQLNAGAVASRRPGVDWAERSSDDSSMDSAFRPVWEMAL